MTETWWDFSLCPACSPWVCADSYQIMFCVGHEGQPYQIFTPYNTMHLHHKTTKVGQMNVGAPDSLQMSVWLRWYTVMRLGSAREVWRGLYYKPSDWLAPGWPGAAGSLEMSDMILRRATHVVPWCAEVTGPASGLVVVGETLEPLYRYAKRWVKFLAVIVGGNCITVIVAAGMVTVHLQHFSYLYLYYFYLSYASRRISTDFLNLLLLPPKPVGHSSITYI